MSQAPERVVCVEGVEKEFRSGLGLRRQRVLDGISFEVGRGEIFGFVGPNGAGKTTTLKILLGLLRPSAGRVEVLGHAVGEAEFRRHVGYLPENPWFYEYLTGREFLRFYAEVSAVPKGVREPRIQSLLERVGLAHAAERRLRTYSKGMLQRVGIAQALVHDPTVIFMDEPMSGLDPIGRKEIRDLILQLHAEGKTVFMNSHILTDVEMLCDRVAIIVKGRIRFVGSPHEVLDEKEHAVDLVLSRVPPELVDRFEGELGGEVRGHGERIEFRMPPAAVDAALQSALAAGATVHAVTPHRASLESIFLSAVEEGSRS